MDSRSLRAHRGRGSGQLVEAGDGATAVRLRTVRTAAPPSATRAIAAAAPIAPLTAGRAVARPPPSPRLDDYDFQFNQFLIDDERPALIHTGLYGMYDDVRAAVGEVVDPGKLDYVVLLHFEADECGGMDRFLDGAPDSTLACCEASALLNLSGWNYRGRVEGHRDGEVIDLGRHKLRFLETPHVHHWDSMMLFDETTNSVFPSDLFIQPGDQPPVVTENLGSEMCGYYREIGIFAHEDPVRRVVDRISGLDPDWIHGMHGGSLPRETIPEFVRALREEPFAYEGKVLGRELPAEASSPDPQA